MESPLDPDSDFATYRVACPTCNTAVWAGHGPPPDEGETLLDGHDCEVPAETNAEPGPNGNEGVTMGGGPEPLDEPAPAPVAQDDTPGPGPVAIQDGIPDPGPLTAP